MSDDEQRILKNDEDQAEVEAHQVSPRMNDEGETEGEDDFEAHHKRANKPKNVG